MSATTLGVVITSNTVLAAMPANVFLPDYLMQNVGQGLRQVLGL